MRTIFVFLVFTLFSGGAVAQPAVMIEDLTTTEVRAAIAGGKTTAFVYFGGQHENLYGPESPSYGEGDEDAIALGKHNFVANYVARRVAEQLGNALALVFPHSPNGDAIKKTGHMAFAGTVSLADDTFERVCRDLGISLISAGFTHVIFAGDHGGGQNLLKKVAEDLDSQWSSKGGHVLFFPVYSEAKKQMRQHLTSMNVPAARYTKVEDAAEVMFVDTERRWVRENKLPPDVAKVASPQLGKILVDQKINLALKYIRSEVPQTASRIP